ncbi:hypothetical protein [Methanolobus chelungpuianus]|uniref:Uncharacterized protein n=1 Tax=Methanolobus chelungpuianus TaxID=502115 RepID=A0AAE3HCM4_9EURY|nr:hypothetical protein [Methanolobus chelungpuianus]MCQ6963702.1 hypothetical protein [Methanolobus chelungpuianus]
MNKQVKFYDIETDSTIIIDVVTEKEPIEFYDYEADNKKLIIFDPENHQMIINVEMLGNEAPWLEGSNYTDRYTFRERYAVELIVSECDHLESWDQIEELLKKHPHDCKQIAVDI